MDTTAVAPADAPADAPAPGVEVVCFVSTLMRHARELGRARTSGDPARIAAAELAHDTYRDQALAADRLVLDLPPR